MRNKIVCLIGLLSAVLGVKAASSNLWSFGLHAGGNTYLATDNIRAKIGYGADLDFGYSHFWQIYPFEFGIHTGVSAGIFFNEFTAPYRSQFTNVDYLGNPVAYTVNVNSVNLKVSPQIQVEVPIMFAFRGKNIFLHAGPKLMVPVFDSYQQSMSGATVDAYYEQVDVHVVNDLLTGVIKESTVQLKGTGFLPKINILLGAEVGYEWEFYNNRLGLGVYADISPWSSYKSTYRSTCEVVEIAPISDPENPPAQVTIHRLCPSQNCKMLYCDFGIKFYYGINNRSK